MGVSWGATAHYFEVYMQTWSESSLARQRIPYWVAVKTVHGARLTTVMSCFLKRLKNNKNDSSLNPSSHENLIQELHCWRSLVVVLGLMSWLPPPPASPHPYSRLWFRRLHFNLDFSLQQTVVSFRSSFSPLNSCGHCLDLLPRGRGGDCILECKGRGCSGPWVRLHHSAVWQGQAPAELWDQGQCLEERAHGGNGSVPFPILSALQQVSRKTLG